VGEAYRLSVLAALTALEDAAVGRAARQGRSADLEARWARYQKLKALALAPGTRAEGAAALSLAMREAIWLGLGRCQ